MNCVFESKGSLLPVEVKYREDPSGIEGLLEFMEEYSVKRGIVVTKDLLEMKMIEGKEIIFIPAWLFLLALDYVG